MTRPASFVIAATLAFAACSTERGPQVGSQTNWLVACEATEECGDLECVCGACTAPCEGDAACSELTGAECVAEDDKGAVALCSGKAPPSGICLPRCDESCAEGTRCVAGVCTPTGMPSIPVTVDPEARHQSLVGFGASLSYAADAIVAHPDKTALYDLLFVESGLDALRLRNRYEGDDDAALIAAGEIVAEASQRLGRAPFLFMTSGSPPARFKANGSRRCGGDPQSCTLAPMAGGGFDYTGFAEHWRASLQAYGNLDVVPDYIGIQNNPNWVPPVETPNEACRFLPVEGTASVEVDAVPTDVAYPGYREALAAVRAALAELPVRPRIGAPELSGLGAVGDYASLLDASAFDALALHLYGVDPTAIDLTSLVAVGELAKQLGRPVFQTEMQAGGLETAVLIHHTLTSAGASAYLQNDLVSLTSEMASVALVLLTDDGFEVQGPYHALSQYARRTDPGWVRVGVVADSAALLSSAWLAPDEGALTVVLINPGTERREAELILPEGLRSRLVVTEVTRTVFDGLERSAQLGALPDDGIVGVPGGSVLTVALAER